MVNVDELKYECRTVEKVLKSHGLSPCREIWVIHQTCEGCPKTDDQCMNCLVKKKWLEKTHILRTNVTLTDGALPVVTLVDTELNEFSEADLNKTVFTKREEAINKI